MIDVHEFMSRTKLALPILYRQLFGSKKMTLEQWQKHYFEWLDEQ